MAGSRAVPLGGLSSPARWRRFLALLVGLLVLSGALPLIAREPDIAALSRQLDHDDFAVREQAERRLATFGQSLVEASFADLAPPPESPYGADLSEYFNQISATAEADLKRRLYDRVAAGLDLEGQFRLERIRRRLSGDIETRVLKIRAQYPTQLPAAQAKLVHGYTGGMRAIEGPWFDASYRNGSSYAVTAVRIRVRLTHKGKQIDQELLLGTSSKPIQPGGSATWSGEVKKPPGATYDFYWQTIAVFGYPVDKSR